MLLTHTPSELIGSFMLIRNREAAINKFFYEVLRSLIVFRLLCF